MIIHDLKLDICPNMKRNEVWVSQYDTDFLIRITLFASKGTFTVESGTTAAIRGTKPDGNGYSANASVSGNVVTVTGDEQMTVVAGRSVYEVTLYRNGKELNTVNFNLRVEHAALDKDTPTSRSQTRELVSIEEHADEIIENVRNMEVFAGDSEAYALGTRGGEAVGTDDPAYQNNSKWYAEQNIPDKTLTLDGRPADAKATGDQLTSIKEDLSESVRFTEQTLTDAQKEQARANIGAIADGLTDEIKQALLNCFQKVAWAVETGKAVYDNLYNAFYPEGSDYPPIPEIEGYTFYDYIELIGSGDNVEVPYRGMIKTGLFDDLNALSFDCVFKPLSGISGNSAVYGGRTINASSIAYSHALYCIPDANTIHATIYTHGKGQQSNNAIEMDSVNRAKIIVKSSSPTELNINGNVYSIPWADGSYVVNSSIHLFGNITEGTGLDTKCYITPKLQVGRIIVRDMNNNIINDYVPAVRGSDHVICLYDIHNNVGHFPVSGSYAQIGNSNCKYTIGKWE